MEKQSIDKLFEPAVALWVILHFISAWNNFAEGLGFCSEPSYSWTAYLLTACYLLSLLMVVFLMAHGRRTRCLARYWLISLLICLYYVLVRSSDFTVMVILSILTPMLPLMPFLAAIPIPEQVFGAALSFLLLLLCLWIQRKSEENLWISGNMKKTR